MPHDEQRIWMIRQLLDEEPYYKEYEIPSDVQGQRDMLRALINVREPKSISEEFLKIQDEYLTRENRAGGITDVDTLPSAPLDDRMILWQGDITELRIDAIVNAANSQLCGCFRPLHNCAGKRH